MLPDCGTVSVLQPTQAKSHSLAFAAQFGVPLYGGTLVGQVVYEQGNAKGCDVFEKKLPATELPTILLVDRGGAPYNLSVA